jgi:hypothetical protein
MKLPISLDDKLAEELNLRLIQLGELHRLAIITDAEKLDETDKIRALIGLGPLGATVEVPGVLVINPQGDLKQLAEDLANALGVAEMLSGPSIDAAWLIERELRKKV